MSQTIDWHQCGSAFYRKTKFYDMKWQSLNLQNVTFAAEKYGGHIAVANNIGENGDSKPQCNILFYTAVGQLCNKAQWKNGTIICMEWSPDTENLIVVNLEGRIFQYSLFGEMSDTKKLSLGQEATDTKINSCQMFDSYTGTGLCALTNANRFYLINNIEEPKVWRTHEVQGKANIKPSCWTVISKLRETKVLCCYGAEIFILEGSVASDRKIPECKVAFTYFLRVALSPDKSKFAFLTNKGTCIVMSNDFQTKFLEFQSDPIVPEKFCWCGSTAVALKMHESLELITFENESVQFTLNPNTKLLEEVDGIRLFDNSQHEFLCVVPDCCVQTFQVAAIAPSATLLEAFKEYEAESYHAYDYINMTSNMEQAVLQCIEAAYHELNVPNQKLLLKAASLGKLFAPDMDANVLVQASRILRVLNAVRHTSISMPITYNQYRNLDIQVLIDRLILRGQWPLAVSICRQMRLSNEKGLQRILTMWLRKKIGDAKARTTDPKILAEQIGWKLAEFPQICLYAQAAEWASETGQKELATILLDNEPNLKMQVTMLIKLGRNEKALAKACDSGDHDLISFVILHLRKSLDKKGDIDLILQKFPVAFAIFKKYCEEENPDHLKALLKQSDDFVNHASCWLKEANSVTTFDVKEKLDALQEAELCFKQQKDDFFQQQLQEHCKLLKIQADLEEKFGEQFLDLSLRETFLRLVSNSGNVDAQNFVNLLKKDFQISDKQFWWWKIEALTLAEKWIDLEKLASSKKSPIGYLPFIEHCMKNGNLTEAEKYLIKVTVDEKVQALMKMNKLDEAAEMAFQKRDLNALNRILSRCDAKTKNVSEKIVQMKQKINSRQKV